MPALAILHQDEDLVAVDKPAGRLVIPGRGAPEPTVREEAEALLGKLWVVHRLDRGTSGVLLFARTAPAHRALCSAFEHHRVTKRYLALVRGLLAKEERVEAPIARGRRGRMRISAGKEGKPAATFVRPLATFPAKGLPELTLVEAFPESGRTHQVRVHLAHLGHPLAVDPDYGDRELLALPSGCPVLSRTPLHAASLELLHPVRGQALRIEAPMPFDMAQAIAAARGEAAQASKSG
ncbi:MAG TPA: RluA family pseudouridine synthase [Anaeromyxobacteraceae bacterium]|nr:RluA family pseudouridine synthase [Anaeromyxobacteraceae bacterium]